MFIGHFGAGLAVKKPAKSVSLGTLFLAAQWLDLIWPLFILIGIEHVVIEPGNSKMTPLEFTDYPYSHSLLFVLIWSILLGVIYFIIKRNKKNALIIGLLVLSHWVLDLIVHIPDLPILPSGPYVGFGLWNLPLIAVIIEAAIFIGGMVFYISSTSPKDKIGIYGFWGLMIFLAAAHIVNLTSPPPPNTGAIGWAGLSMWILVLWAYWVDKHRAVK